MTQDKSKILFTGAVALAVLLIGAGAMIFLSKEPETPRVKGTQTPAPVTTSSTRSAVPGGDQGNTAAAARPENPGTTPAPQLPTASALPARAPSDLAEDQEDSPGTSSHLGPTAPGLTGPKLTPREGWNNEMNAYTIEFQEKLNELEYRRVVIMSGLPIELSRHDAIMKLYRDSIARMKEGTIENLAAERQRVLDEEKQIMTGARDSDLVGSRK